MRPIILGIFAAFFFAFTFVLNASMELGGGSWIWSASLRYFFMVPFLLVIVAYRGKLKLLLTEMKQKPREWFIWSLVGFGLFRSEEHTSELQSRGHLVCRPLHQKHDKNKTQ